MKGDVRQKTGHFSSESSNSDFLFRCNDKNRIKICSSVPMLQKSLVYKQTLCKVFATKIIPLLQEYFYDDWEKIQIVLGDHKEQFKKYRDDYQKVAKFVNDVPNNEINVLGFDHDDYENDKSRYEINDFSKLDARSFLKIFNPAV